MATLTPSPLRMLARFGAALVPSLLAAAACGGSTDGGSSGTGVKNGEVCPVNGQRTYAVDGCNTCTCTAGKWVCTTTDCTQACVNGTTQSDGCNTCTCISGGWACTKKACSACVDGATKTDGCNTCSCSAGTWMCTARACPPDGGGKGCGGWLGNPCTATEYCAYEPGQLCGAADASSVCKPRPEACDLIYAPVCGCDGTTYGNDCQAASAGTGVMHTGTCP